MAQGMKFTRRIEFNVPEVVDEIYRTDESSWQQRECSDDEEARSCKQGQKLSPADYWNVGKCPMVQLKGSECGDALESLGIDCKDCGCGQWTMGSTVSSLQAMKKAWMHITHASLLLPLGGTPPPHMGHLYLRHAHDLFCICTGLKQVAEAKRKQGEGAQRCIHMCCKKCLPMQLEATRSQRSEEGGPRRRSRVHRPRRQPCLPGRGGDAAGGRGQGIRQRFLCQVLVPVAEGQGREREEAKARRRQASED